MIGKKSENKKDVNIKKSENIDDFGAKILELETQLKETAALIDKAEDERLIAENQMKKALADYSNLQRDMDKRNEIALTQLKAKAALEIINVIDDVNYALQAKETIEMTEQVKAWIDGLVATLRNLQKSLDVLGVRPMNVQKGDKFESSIHMALATVPDGEQDTIIDVVQDGYVLGSAEIAMIVRPARVIVCKKSL